MNNLAPKFEHSPKMAPKLKKNLYFVMSQTLPIFPTVRRPAGSKIEEVEDDKLKKCSQIRSTAVDDRGLNEMMQRTTARHSGTQFRKKKNLE